MACYIITTLTSKTPSPSVSLGLILKTGFQETPNVWLSLIFLSSRVIPHRNSPSALSEDVRVLQGVVSQTSHARYSGDKDQPFQWIHIWHVRVEADDALKATRLVSVPCCYQFLPWLFSLNADVAARPIRYEEQNWIDVYWWKECTSTHVVRCAYPVKVVFVREPAASSSSHPTDDCHRNMYV